MPMKKKRNNHRDGDRDRDREVCAITPKSSLALMGIVPPSGLDGYEAGEKIGEKIKIFES